MHVEQTAETGREGDWLTDRGQAESVSVLYYPAKHSA